MNTSKTTRCPNCGVDIDVNELLYHQLDKQARKKYQDQLAAEQNKLQEQQTELAAQRRDIEATINTQLEQLLAKERSELQAKLRMQVEQDNAERINEMKAELDDKSKKVIQLHKTQGEVERLKREKESLRAEIELDVEKKFSRQLAEQSAKIQKQINEQVSFKVAEKEEVINQLKSKLSEAQRKADQSSMQIQGEVQELAIEQWLRSNFPLDAIEEIKKGVSGADTLQVINTQKPHEMWAHLL